MHNWAVECNVAAFQSFPLLYAGRECYTEASTMSNSANLISSLTTAVMVDNLAEKVDECPLNQGRKVLFVYNWDAKAVVLRSSEVSAIEGLLKY